jgi:hypothetical protein
MNQPKTKHELISQVRNELRIANSDSRLNDRFLWSIIEKHSEWLIKRESKKLRVMTQDTIFQTLKCVDVVDAPAVDECCGIRTKCKVFRTKDKVPELYSDDMGVIIKSVYTIDGSKDFSEITINEYMRKLENPHSKYDKSSYFFYNNGYLYFPKSTIRKVMVKGYFKSEIINDCEACPSDVDPCLPFIDTPVRIPTYLIAELLQHVLAELTSLTLKIQQEEQIDKNETRKS